MIIIYTFNIVKNKNNNMEEIPVYMSVRIFFMLYYVVFLLSFLCSVTKETSKTLIKSIPISKGLDSRSSKKFMLNLLSTDCCYSIIISINTYMF